MALVHSTDIRKKFKSAIFFTLGILMLEIWGGIWTHSLALLSDAAHLFMDVFSLTLSWFTMRLAEKPATDTKTFGLHRTETFAAFINGFTLILVSLWIFYTAVDRFTHPEPIHSTGMLVVAAIGFSVNLIVVFKLKDHDHNDLNVRSAFLHVIGDALASLGVIAGGIIIAYTGWYVVDPVVSFGIGLIILFGSVNILRKSLHILLEGVPESVTYRDVLGAIRIVDGVEDIHELHIWSLCSNTHSLSAHIVVGDQMVSHLSEIMEKINKVAINQFNISHTTLQFECKDNSPDHGACIIRH